MCPQSVALGVSPVNRLCGCQVADAGSIPETPLEIAFAIAPVPLGDMPLAVFPQLNA